MKKIYFLLAVVIALISCKKESTKPYTVTKKMTKLVYVYNGGSPETQTYSYDAQGRFTQIVYDNNTESFVYNSATSFTVTTRKNSDNSITSIKECSQDATGRITKILFKNAGGTPTSSYDYTYNAEGYMVQDLYTQISGTPYTSGSEYFLTDGNMTSIKHYDNGVHVSTSEWTYDMGKLNKEQWTYGGYWPSATWFGKGSKNIGTTYKKRDTSNTLTWHTELTWQLDTDGYASSVNKSFPLLGTQGTQTYTYQ